MLSLSRIPSFELFKYFYGEKAFRITAEVSGNDAPMRLTYLKIKVSKWHT